MGSCGRDRAGVTLAGVPSAGRESDMALVMLLSVLAVGVSFAAGMWVAARPWFRGGYAGITAGAVVVAAGVLLSAVGIASLVG